VLTVKFSPITMFPHEGAYTLSVYAHVRRTQSFERAEASRFAQSQIEHYRRLARVAHPDRLKCLSLSASRCGEMEDAQDLKLDFKRFFDVFSHYLPSSRFA